MLNMTAEERLPRRVRMNPPYSRPCRLCSRVALVRCHAAIVSAVSILKKVCVKRTGQCTKGHTMNSSCVRQVNCPPLARFVRVHVCCEISEDEEGYSVRHGTAKVGKIAMLVSY